MARALPLRAPLLPLLLLLLLAPSVGGGGGGAGAAGPAAPGAAEHRSDEDGFLAAAYGELLPLYCLLAVMMGLGKGGVPGSSTSSVALNALYAPDVAGGMDLAAALQVPVTFMADVTVVMRNYQNVDRAAVARLMAPTIAGVAVGAQLMGTIGKAEAKILIGGILLAILALNLLQSKLSGKGDAAPSYATSMWFASVVGVTGGFATILTNSMGPMLNVYLLTLRLDPFVFVGTRGTFFTTINTIKIALRMWNGTLSRQMLMLGCSLGCLSVVGALLSKYIVARLSKRLFTRLEYTLMTYAALKLLDAGLGLGVFDGRIFSR